MANLLKWQQEIIDRIATMSNDDLLDNTITAAQGDDWDGCFTERGLWEFTALQNELCARLIDAGFLSKDYLTRE